MTEEEILAELAQVNAAIAVILGTGQQYSLGTGQTTQQVSRGNLATLYRRKDKLEEMLEAARGYGSSGAVFKPGW